MASPMGSSSTAGGATDGTDDEGQDRPQNSRRFYHRHTPHQIAKLEEAFNACAHPSDSMRRQLGTELGLEPRQVKFWFQNRRTQAKAQADRSNNCALRRENERMMAENLMFRESLKSVVCITCGGPTIRDDDCHIRLEQFKLENDFLVQEASTSNQLDSLTYLTKV
ncbi:homeobox-leucine zipper protein ROC8-like [Arachis hypogaea]|uniref:homeobox-leucine zipper protein ROC8-like n=1 Tax=Arachis hypogaea TaxID=3818 RepID=UPI000DED27DC|nr:homeobox-leucine zipper protein ROC8-like [Arachis hypogaea]